MNVITKVICLEYAEKISELMPIWEKESIGEEGADRRQLLGFRNRQSYDNAEDGRILIRKKV